jgi:lipopolysaccharide export system protein LptC
MFGHKAVLTVAIAALLFAIAVGWSLRPLQQPGAQQPTQFLALGLHRASIVVRHQGERQAEVRAERVEVSRDLRYATFSGIPTITVFFQEREAFYVRGSRIVLDRQTGDVAVQGPVEVASMQGERLMAGTARWTSAEQQLIFEQRVTMATGDQELVAEQLAIDVRQQTMDFSGAVDVAFRLKGLSP